jgi:hypothetical protein
VVKLNEKCIDGHSRSLFIAVDAHLQQLAEDWTQPDTVVGQEVRLNARGNEGGMYIFAMMEKTMRPLEGSALAEAVGLQSQWERTDHESPALSWKALMHARERTLTACTEAAGYDYTFHAFNAYHCTIVFTNMGRRLFKHSVHWRLFKSIIEGRYPILKRRIAEY